MDAGQPGASRHPPGERDGHPHAARSRGFHVVDRLGPGRTLEGAQAEMDIIVPGMWESHFRAVGPRGWWSSRRLTD